MAASVLALGLAGCGGDGAPDPSAFCAAIESLREDDPFEELAIASPGEMRDAFADLAERAGDAADDAPEDAEVQADRYVAAIEVLRGELAGAGYDPRRVDTTRYAAGVREYQAAAGSLTNAADATCS